MEVSHLVISVQIKVSRRVKLVTVLLLLSQLDNVDEQAAQIRRELDGRLQLADKISRVRAVKCSSVQNHIFILTMTRLW